MPELRTFIRFFLLLFHRSKVPTSFVPLDQISSVAVLRTEDEYGLDKEINDFFNRFGIRVRLLSKRDKRLRTDEDLFISLLAERGMDETYAVECSTAKFKVGIHDIKNYFDLTVVPPEGGDARQVAIFQVIADILQKIR